MSRLTTCTEPVVFKQSPIPGFSVGEQRIGVSLSILELNGRMTFFTEGDHRISHPQDDIESRRFVWASLRDIGHGRVVDLEGAPLPIPHPTPIMCGARCRSENPAAFLRNAPAARLPLKNVQMKMQMNVQCACLPIRAASL